MLAPIAICGCPLNWFTRALTSLAMFESVGGFKHEVQHGTLIDENTIYVNRHLAGAEAVQPKSAQG